MTARSHGLSQAMQDYLLSNGVREPEIVRRLRDDSLKLDQASWASAPEQGQFLSMLALISGATSFLEVGTFTGYTALWMALTMPQDAKIVTLDLVDDFVSIGRPYWQEAGVEARIDLRLGDASDTLKALAEEGRSASFDMAYIDANKQKYPDYYEMVLGLIRPGGLIVADNMFWSGSVADPDDQKKSTNGIRTLAKTAHDDPRVDVSMLPLGDGMLLARKKG